MKLLLSQKLRRYLLLLVVITVAVVEIPIVTVGYLTKPVPSDTIIVLGAKLIGDQPSTMLRLRLDEAVQLYNQGFAPSIIVSGAQGLDEIASEADVMRTYLIAKGIPPEKIYVENKSFNTYQNLLYSKNIMRDQGFRQAIIVSNSSHIRRSLVLAQQLGIEASGSPAPMADNAYLTAKQYAREGAAMLSLLVFNR
ncbi:YdcF family protein [Sporomusa sp.]|uniref:YdcF family protein n=1 Tax=Sporomusa sp. TaxID=2078658 RepID=UPI002B8FA02A|nr:YdcF family protein [Sporomusa sp.]HWR43803.1 YdcF family protein [Sporomusa sp.]